MSNILSDKKFKQILKNSLREVFSLLLNKVDEFSIVVYKDAITFNPKLPKELELKEDIILFDIANYTFSTFKLSEDSCSFEAGFGANDFATTLEINLNGIAQILLQDEVIFVNLTKYEKETNPFLLNPENKKFIR